MAVASNMRLFTVRAIGTVWVLVIFQFSKAVAVWTSDIEIHSEVNSENPGNSKIEEAVDLTRGEQVFAAAPQYPWMKPYQPEGTSYQPQLNSPQLFAYPEPTNQEYSTTPFHSNRIGVPPPASPPASLPPVPTMHQIYRQAFRTLQPQFQQQFQQLLKQYSPPQFQQPWHFLQVQQAPQNFQWQQLQHPPRVSLGSTYSPRYPTWPMLPVQHQTPQQYYWRQSQVPQYTQPVHRPHPSHHRSRLNEFEREYRNRELTNANAQDIMKNLETLIGAIRPLNKLLPADLRFQLFQQAADLLSRVASLAVVMISHRNNSDMDKQVDDFLHKMEEKSYQLKTMLIEMQSFASENIAVATPPENVYQPTMMWGPVASYSWMSPIGRDLENPEGNLGHLGNLDR